MRPGRAAVRVSVVAGSRRVDLAVPAAVTVAELLPGLASTLALTSYAGLRLSTLDGSVLSDSAGLSGQVPDGSVLVLAAEPPSAPVFDDITEALASVVATVPAWRSDWTGAVRLAAVSMLLALGCAGLALVGSSRTASIAALAASAGAVALSRRAPGPAVVLGWSATASAAVAGCLLAPSSPPLAWTGAGGAALAVGGVVFAGLDRGRLWLLPALMAAGAATLAGALLAHAPPRPVLSLLLVVAALLHGSLPRLLASRLGQQQAPVDVARLARQADRARELLLALSAGAGLLIVALTPTGPLVGVACAVLVALRIRHHRARAEVLTGAITSVLGVVAAAVTVLVLEPEWRAVVAGATAAAGLLLLAPSPAEPRRSWLLDRAEAVCLIALPPLLLLTTGAVESLPWIR